MNWRLDRETISPRTRGVISGRQADAWMLTPLSPSLPSTAVLITEKGGRFKLPLTDRSTAEGGTEGRQVGRQRFVVSLIV